MRHKHLLIAATWLAALGPLYFPAQAQTQAPAESAATRLQGGKVDRESLISNMESVGKLLESSSAARQIESSKTAIALEQQVKARDIYAKAKAALAADDLPRASQLLSEARNTFFGAVRLAAPEEVSASKLESDYKARLESVNALLAAYKRVATEKSGAAKGVPETVAQIDVGVAAAAKLAQASKFKEGRVELDRVYLIAKAGISSLRSGDTLVRSLNFATKEEEYVYEVDRNNTHQMLIEVLASEKRSDSMVQKFIAAAKVLRTEADTAGQRKDFVNGIRLLEESTAELVRAIRGAGIYIPG
jgi:hypothetical protein